MPLLLLILLFPSLAHASPLSVEVSPAEDGMSRARIMLSATTTSVNAVEATLSLPPEARVHTLASGAGLIHYWIEAPRIEGDTLRFAGIIPGGFVGAASPDYGLAADAELLSFTFSGEANFSLDEGAVYLNDGEGTKVSFDPAPLPVRSGSVAAEPDRTPPEYVDVFFLEDQQIAPGGHVLVVDAYDAHSGIDYVQVQEQEGWVRVEGVYALKDRWGIRSIRVRAYDRAGNFIETMVPGRNRDLLVLGILAALLLGALAVYLLRKRTAP